MVYISNTVLTFITYYLHLKIKLPNIKRIVPSAVHVMAKTGILGHVFGQKLINSLVDFSKRIK